MIDMPASMLGVEPQGVVMNPDVPGEHGDVRTVESETEPGDGQPVEEAPVLREMLSISLCQSGSSSKRERALREELARSQAELRRYTASEVGGNAAKREARRVLVDDAELMEEREPEWLLDGMLGELDQLMIAGPTAVGKTTFAVGLALSVATGTPFFGHRAHTPGPVIYVCLESRSTLRSRIRSAKANGGWQLDRPVGISVYEGSFEFANSEAISTFCGEVEGLQPKLVVVDTLARAAVGLEENSATDMGKLIAGADRIRDRLDCGLILLHHTGKDGTKERGSSALGGAVDGVWLLRGSSRGVTVTCSKARNWEPFSPIELRRAPGPSGGVVLCLDGVTNGPNAGERAVIAALPRAGQLMKVKEIVAASGTSQAAVYRHLARLKNAGIVVQEGPAYKLCSREILGDLAD